MNQGWSRRKTIQAIVGGLTIGTGGCIRSRTEDIHSIEEAFITPDRGSDIDQPAVWHGDGTHLLVVTAKQSHELLVFDATDGTYLRVIGEYGSNPGEFQRPNGLYIVDDLAIVVERDNHRVQVLTLPSGESLGTFGESRLRRPYEGTIVRNSEGYDIYVTDDYDASSTADLNERVKHYRFTISDEEVNAQYVRTFGATSDRGALHKVESIFADPEYDRLMIADEDEYAIRLYDPAGEFVDTVTTIFSDGEPEGITLQRYDSTSGYWIFTEQTQSPIPFLNPRLTKFHLFDRRSLDYHTSFKGSETRFTDGVWLTQNTFGPFQSGAFYAAHDDKRIAAFQWEKIANIVDNE